jgi:phosphopantetheinyl transferase
MPLLLSKPINTYSSYAIWNISETEQELVKLIQETPPIHLPNKKSEWIVTRILAKYLCDIYDLAYQGVHNLDTGKPVLTNLNAEISITHSFPLAAVLINLNKPCGIDLEWPREKLGKVKSKFLHSSEENYPQDTETLCKIWSAKEVLFKVHGAKNLSFKDQMRIEFEDDWKARGHIMKNGSSESHVIEIEPIYRYLIAFNI